MSFLRKASMKLKPNEDGTTSPSARSVSSSSGSIRDPKRLDDEDGSGSGTETRRRKPSLASVRIYLVKGGILRL
jgi:hypothetical protein